MLGGSKYKIVHLPQTVVGASDGTRARMPRPFRASGRRAKRDLRAGRRAERAIALAKASSDLAAEGWASERASCANERANHSSRVRDCAYEGEKARTTNCGASVT